MKIAIWAEHATLAGRRAWRREDEEDWKSDDIVVYEGTDEELGEMAELLERNTKPGSHYATRCARTIRQAIGIADPDDD